MAAAFKAFLLNTIGFANDAEAVRVRATGLDLFATLAEYNKEDVQSLVCTLKKDNTNPMTIGPIVKKRLIPLASLSKFYTWMTRTVNSTSLSKNRLSDHGDYMNLLEELKIRTNRTLRRWGRSTPSSS